MDRKTIRQAFKAIGYSVSFQRNLFNDGLCNIAFKNSGLLKPVSVTKSSVYDAEFYKNHKAAFDLATRFRGEFLEDTEQKIV